MNEHGNKPQPEEIWNGLSEPEQWTCLFFAASHWETGMRKADINAMGVEDEHLRSLVDKGIVTGKPSWLLYKELADGLEDQAKTIQATSVHYPNRRPDIETNILERYRRYRNNEATGNEELRYRFTDYTFYDYVRTSQDEE